MSTCRSIPSASEGLSAESGAAPHRFASGDRATLSTNTAHPIGAERLLQCFPHTEGQRCAWTGASAAMIRTHKADSSRLSIRTVGKFEPNGCFQMSCGLFLRPVMILFCLRKKRLEPVVNLGQFPENRKKQNCHHEQQELDHHFFGLQGQRIGNVRAFYSPWEWFGLMFRPINSWLLLKPNEIWHGGLAPCAQTRVF
jgi:hypothetical protein